MASWLVRSTPERAVRIRALAWDIVLCSWARYFTLTVPLSTQEYKWVLANCDGLASRPGEVEILLAAPCYRSYHNFSVKARLGAKPLNSVELGNSLLFL